MRVPAAIRRPSQNTEIVELQDYLWLSGRKALLTNLELNDLKALEDRLSEPYVLEARLVATTCNNCRSHIVKGMSFGWVSNQIQRCSFAKKQ